MRRGGGGRRDQDGVLARDGEELVCRQIAVDVGGCRLCGGFMVFERRDRVQAPKRDGIRPAGKTCAGGVADRYDLTQGKGGGEETVLLICSLQAESSGSTPGRGGFQASGGGERSVGIEKKGGSKDGRTKKKQGRRVETGKTIDGRGDLWMPGRRCDWNLLKLSRLGSCLSSLYACVRSKTCIGGCVFLCLAAGWGRRRVLQVIRRE